MPKSRNSDRSKSSVEVDAAGETPPEHDAVERAIEAIVERLAPKQRKPKPDNNPISKPDRKFRAQLRVVGGNPVIR